MNEYAQCLRWGWLLSSHFGVESSLKFSLSVLLVLGWKKLTSSGLDWRPGTYKAPELLTASARAPPFHTLRLGPNICPILGMHKLSCRQPASALSARPVALDNTTQGQGGPVPRTDCLSAGRRRPRYGGPPATRWLRQRTGQPGACRDVTAPRPRKAPPWPRPRCVWLSWALGRTDMARELRALLLWGRRLRAPALAAFPGGEGGRAGGGGDVRGPLRPRARSFSVGGAEDSVRLVRPARGERRPGALRATWFHPAQPRAGLSRSPSK